MLDVHETIDMAKAMGTCDSHSLLEPPSGISREDSPLGNLSHFQPTTETRVVHVKDKVPGAVYIGRANPRWHLAASPFANSYTIGKHGDRARVLHYYASDLYMYRNKPGDIMHLLPGLRGKPLACWCRHDGEECTAENRCHGDILVEALNRYTDDELRSFGSAVQS